MAVNGKCPPGYLGPGTAGGPYAGQCHSFNLAPAIGVAPPSSNDGKKAGAAIGATVGTVGGSFLGPLAAPLGAVGGLLGGLFGGLFD